MKTTLTARIAALSTAFMMTFAMLASIETLATGPAPQGLLSQVATPASQPA